MTNFEKYCKTPDGLLEAIAKHSNNGIFSVCYGERAKQTHEIELFEFRRWLESESGHKEVPLHPISYEQLQELAISLQIENYALKKQVAETR